MKGVSVVRGPLNRLYHIRVVQQPGRSDLSQPEEFLLRALIVGFGVDAAIENFGGGEETHTFGTVAYGENFQNRV